MNEGRNMSTNQTAGTRRLVVDLDPDLYKRMKHAAVNRDVTLRAFVEEAISRATADDAPDPGLNLNWTPKRRREKTNE